MIRYNPTVGTTKTRIVWSTLTRQNLADPEPRQGSRWGGVDHASASDWPAR